MKLKVNHLKKKRNEKSDQRERKKKDSCHEAKQNIAGLSETVTDLSGREQRIKRTKGRFFLLIKKSCERYLTDEVVYCSKSIESVSGTVNILYRSSLKQMTSIKRKENIYGYLISTSVY